MVDLLFHSKWGLVILAGIVFLFLLLLLLKKVFSQRKLLKEQRQQAADRARDENLNSIILNSHSAIKQPEVFVPYDVDYSKTVNTKSSNRIKRGKNSNRKDGSDLMVQIIENTELSTRKFVLNISKGIKIGSTAQDCDISFQNEMGIYKVELFELNGEVYVRNQIDGSRAVISRKKQNAIIDSRGINVHSGDVISMGKNQYTVVIIN